MRSLVITAALTGVVPTKKDNPALPVTPDEVVSCAVECVEKGASVVHVHARDREGLPTFKADVYREILSGIKDNCDAVVCASTSGRAFKGYDMRAEVLSLRPEMATLTLGSFNARDGVVENPPWLIHRLAARMNELGIKPELEAFEPGMVNYAVYMRKKGWLSDRPPVFGLFLGALGTIPAGWADMDYLVSCLPEGAVWGATGIGRCQFQVNMMAVLKGGNVRVGLEDYLYYDTDKREMATNPGLVERVARFSREKGRKVASPGEARGILGLGGCIV